MSSMVLFLVEPVAMVKLSLDQVTFVALLQSMCREPSAWWGKSLKHLKRCTTVLCILNTNCTEFDVPEGMDEFSVGVLNNA